MKGKMLNQVHKAFRRYGISMLYENKFGVKALNPIMSSELLKAYRDKPVHNVLPKKLKLGVDSLKDNFTLLNTFLEASPHFFLMCHLNEHLQIDPNCEYWRRSINGTLDFRRARSPDVSVEKFNKRKSAILNDEYLPIYISETKAGLFIIDGKHRAALCMALGKPVKAIFVNNFIHDSYYFWLMRRMTNSPNIRAYSKHLSFFQLTFSNMIT